MKEDVVIDSKLDINDQVYYAIRDASNVWWNLSDAGIMEGDYNDLVVIEIAKMILSLRK